MYCDTVDVYFNVIRMSRAFFYSSITPNYLTMAAFNVV